MRLQLEFDCHQLNEWAVEREAGRMDPLTSSTRENNELVTNSSTAKHSNAKYLTWFRVLEYQNRKILNKQFYSYKQWWNKILSSFNRLSMIEAHIVDARVHTNTVVYACTQGNNDCKTKKCFNQVLNLHYDDRSYAGNLVFTTSFCSWSLK